MWRLGFLLIWYLDIMIERGIQNIKFSEVFFHLVFWLLIVHFIFDLSGLYHSYEHLVFVKNGKFDEAFLFLPLCIVLFYWNLLVLIPKFLNQGKWILFSISLIVSYLFIFLCADGLYDFVESKGFAINLHHEEFLDHFIPFSLMTVIVSSSLGIAKMALNNAISRREAIEKQKEAEMKYLRSQFSPHFLHNTLNGLYSKAIEERANGTAEAIVTLSEIMRYPLNLDSKKEVALADEIKFINDYISIQKIRLGEDYPIVFNNEVSSDKVQILPLSLIELVENAFKYGVSQKNKTPIIFDLKQMNDTIIFKTTNSISGKEKIDSNKIGLKNLRARLQLFYGDKYILTTKSIENQFFSMLELNSYKSQ